MKRLVELEKGPIRADLAAARSALIGALLETAADAGGSPGWAIALSELADGDRHAAAILAPSFATSPPIPPPESSPDIVLHDLLTARQTLLAAFAVAGSGTDPSTSSLDGSVVRLLQSRAAADRQVALDLQSSPVQLSNRALDVLRIEALRAARKELLTTVALIPEEERPTQVVTTGETLRERLVLLEAEDRDVLARLQMIEERVEQDSERWDETWKRLHRTRQGLLRALEGPRSDITTATVIACINRDRELAAQLRTV